MADTYQHGVYIEELTTALQPLQQVVSPNVIIGTAIKGKTNEPILCQNMSDFVEEFGWTDDFSSFTLEEAAYVHFSLFNVAPIICINILDRTRHVVEKSVELTGTANPFTLTGPIILSTLKVTSGNAVLESGTDYKTSRTNLELKLTVLNQSKVTGDKIAVQYSEIDESKVTSADVIGSVNDAGQETGLEVLENVYPKLGLVPGTIIAPKYSRTPSVAQAMASKAPAINGVFKSIAISDIDAATVRKYTDVYEYKGNRNLVDAHLITCWPKVKLDGRQYHLSTQLAALMNAVDATHDQIPYESPSNKLLRMDSTSVESGTEIYLSKPKANMLNGGGVVTALNWAGAWRAWGNRTAIYPTSNDPKDNFIPCRRMMNFLCNTLALNYFSRIDNPMNRRLVQSVLDEVGIFLNGLAARGAILGGQVQFLEQDNPLTDLADGRIKFHVAVGLVPPARTISFILEYDVRYLQNLFS